MPQWIEIINTYWPYIGLTILIGGSLACVWLVGDMLMEDC